MQDGSPCPWYTVTTRTTPCKVQTLHNVADLQHLLQRAPIEVGCEGLSRTRDRQISLILIGIVVPQLNTFDITVTSMIYVGSGHIHVPVRVFSSAKAAEWRKHFRIDPKCAELGWRCIPLTACGEL